jgi:omega-amidase
MSDLHVTLVQARQCWEDKEANFQHYEDLLAGLGETDLIVLPEMFHTGFSMSAERLADPADGSIGIRWLQQQARAFNAAFYTSLMVADGGRYFNRGVFVTPEGGVSTYDKRKTFGLAGEDKVYTAGTKETIVAYRGWNIQLQICYDLRFPEIARNRIVAGDAAAYDVLLYVANWPARRGVHWKTLLPARAIENQCWVAAVNRVGEDGNALAFSGNSMFVDALGNVTECADGREDVKTMRLSHDDVMNTRKTMPFLKDRG